MTQAVKFTCITGIRQAVFSNATGIWSNDPTLFAFSDLVGKPYMFRITDEQGAIRVRTDLHSLEQIGQGATNPGGGVVLHGEDFTYSLLIPRSGNAGGGAAVLPAAGAGSYGLIHGALCSALADAGIPARPSSASTAKISQACFENPVLHDVLVRGRKVAGAAQRRTRAGLIHQGSIQGLDLPPAFGAAFAARLACVVRPRTFDLTLAAEKLAAEKYATRAWLEKRM